MPAAKNTTEVNEDAKNDTANGAENPYMALVSRRQRAIKKK